VAVKFLHPWIAAQKAFLSRFDVEARAMSRLSTRTACRSSTSASRARPTS
jgi:hypothetical protein